MGKKMLADEVRGAPEGIADPDIDARLAIVDGKELGVAVGEVQQADVAEWRDRVQVGRFIRNCTVIRYCIPDARVIRSSFDRR